MQTRGRCGCGNVRFEVNGEPRVQLYCHCQSCRTAHAAPLIAGAVFPADAVTYTGDVILVNVSGRADAPKRLACAACGTKVLIEPMPGYRTVLPALCESAEWFTPLMHINWSEKVVAFRDDLPKFLDVPKEMGGSGQLGS